MKYSIFEGDLAQEVAAADLTDNFAGEIWAKQWVCENAKTDRYTLRRSDGSLTLSILRTGAGQWYLTPQAIEA
jgi:hypothetical protein